MDMEFAYGNGVYTEGEKKFEGKIVLSEHKLFLKGAEGDLAQTFVPLEKIEKIKKVRRGIEVHVRPSLTYRYCAVFSGEARHINELVKDIVEQRGLKKRFLLKEWVETEQ